MPRVVGQHWGRGLGLAGHQTQLFCSPASSWGPLEALGEGLSLQGPMLAV